jgi:hypothetical protein
VNFFIRSSAQGVFLALAAVIIAAVLLAGASSSALVSGIAVVASFVAMSIWFATIAEAANARLPENLRLNHQTIKMTLVVSNIAAAALFVGVLPNLSVGRDQDSEIPVMLPFPLGLLAVGGLIYLAALASKQLVTFERGRQVNFQEYLSTLVLFWFWYIGIWSLQPRVRRLSQ